jgi:hypothetical protein
VYLAKAAEDEILEELASDPASAYHQNLGLGKER